MRAAAFTISERLALDACTRCGQCLDVCPAVRASGDAELSAQVRMARLKGHLTRRNGFMRNLMECFGFGPTPEDDNLTDYGTSVFRCSLCGDCAEVCPVGLPIRELWLDLRRELAAGGHAPAKTRAIRANLESSHNVFDEDNDERADWLENMRRAPRGVVKRRAQTVYFTGCVGAYFPLAQKIPMALVELLAAAGDDFTVMGPDEWCCGFPLLGSGQPDALEQIVLHNVEEVRKRGATTVVFTCPSCLQIWKERYAEYADLSGLRLVHASEYVLDLVRSGSVPLGRLDTRVTYHDPCDLGRGGGVFNDPRELLRAVPGLELVEMEHHGRHSLCCGGGGNLEMIDPKLSSDMAARRVAEAQATGAEIVVTSCQQCVRTLATHVRRNKVALEVIDLTQLLARSLAAGAAEAKAAGAGASGEKTAEDRAPRDGAGS